MDREQSNAPMQESEPLYEPVSQDQAENNSDEGFDRIQNNTTSVLTTTQKSENETNKIEDDSAGEISEDKVENDIAKSLDTTFNRITFFCFGMGRSLPSMCIHATSDYFRDRFPEHKESIMVTLSWATSMPEFFAQVAVFNFLPRFPNHLKLTFTFLLNTLIVIGIWLVPRYDKSDDSAYYLTIGLAFLYGANHAILKLALYEAAGPTPSFVKNLSIGHSLISLIKDAVRMILLATLTSKIEGVQVYYYIAFFFLSVCTVLAFRFSRQHDTVMA